MCREAHFWGEQITVELFRTKSDALIIFENLSLYDMEKVLLMCAHFYTATNCDFLLLWVWAEGLWLHYEAPTRSEMVVHLLEESLDAIITPVEVYPLGQTQSQDHIILCYLVLCTGIIFGDIILLQRRNHNWHAALSRVCTDVHKSDVLRKRSPFCILTWTRPIYSAVTTLKITNYCNRPEGTGGKSMGPRARVSEAGKGLPSGAHGGA